MNREELVKAAEAAQKKCTAEYEVLTKKMKDVLDTMIKSAGLDTFTKVRHISDSCAEIEIDRPGKDWGRTFSLYYSRPWGDEKRKVELNVGTFGSFSADDQPEVNFYIAAGKFASALKEIQDCFEDIDFETYYDARNASYRADDEVKKFDAEVKRAADEKLKIEIATKLVPGAKVNVGVDWGGKAKIDEILKVTPKRIYFRYYARILNKDEVISNFMRQRNPWTFAA